MQSNRSHGNGLAARLGLQRLAIWSCLGLAACTTGAAEPSAAGGADDTQPESAAQVATQERLFATVRNVKFEGELCPKGEFEVEVNKERANTRWGNQLTTDGPAVTQGCALVYDLEVPAGYQFQSPFLRWETYYAGSPQARNSLRATYSFDGTPPQQHTFSLRDDETAETKLPFTTWSPTCSGGQGPSRVRLNVNLSATVSGPDSPSLSFYTFDASFGFEGGTVWRRCGGGTVSQPAAGRGDDCGGEAMQKCASGSVCEYPSKLYARFGERTPGKCVRPSFLPPPAAAVDAACGGVNRIGCQRGAVCHYVSQSVSLPNTTGFCAATYPAANGACAGYPNINCGAGLACVPDRETARMCVPAGGRQGDLCGPSFTTCGSGLRCAAALPPLPAGSGATGRCIR